MREREIERERGLNERRKNEVSRSMGGGGGEGSVGKAA